MSQMVEKKTGPITREWKLLQLSAGTEAALQQATYKLAEYLKENPGLDLADVAFTLKTGRRSYKYRRTAVCSDTRDAINVLSSIVNPESPGYRRIHTGMPAAPGRPVVFMFSGQGSLYVNMGLDLYNREPQFREEVDRCFHILESFSDLTFKDAIYPSPGSLQGYREAKKKIADVRYIGPITLLLEYSAAKLLMKWGLKPDALIGYSFGEYTAACLSGVFSLEDVLKLTLQRGEMMLRVPVGSMMSVPLPEKKLEQLLPGNISIAAVNGPGFCIVSGPPEPIKRLRDELRAGGHDAYRFRVPRAGHSRMMVPFKEEFMTYFKGIHMDAPKIPYISGLTGTWITRQQAASPGYWSQHMTETIRFCDGIGQLIRELAPIFVQLGSDKTLPMFVNQQQEKGRPILALNMVKHREEKVPDLRFLLSRLGQLWMAGIRINWSEFYSYEKRKPVHFPRDLFRYKAGAKVNVPLERVDQAGPTVSNAYIPPRNDMEQKLVGICNELFDFERIGVRDDFFELGGDSLKAVVYGTLIHKELQVKVPMTEIFKRPTIEALAQYLGGAEESEYASLAPPESREYYTLSSAQKRIYFMQQMNRGGTYYNVPYVMALEGKLENEKLEYAFARLVRRHESFRTGFDIVDDEPVQRVRKSVDFAIEYREAASEVEVETIIRRFIRAFDLSRAPLLRIGLISIKNRQEQSIMMVDMHHLIGDGVSGGILVREFMKSCAGEELSPLKLQYTAFSQWQNWERKRGAFARQEEYWRDQFAGDLPVLNLPSDFPRPEVKRFAGSRCYFPIEEETLRRLKDLARQEEVTLFVLMLAVYNILLSKLSGQEDIVVGTPVAGRLHPDLRNIIGMFVNTIALRNFPSGEKSFIEFLREVKEKSLAGIENQECQFEDLIDRVGAARDTSRNPLFDTIFAIYKLDTPEIKIPGLKLKPFDFTDNVSKFDMTVIGKEEKGTLRFTIEYCTELFRENTIKAFMQYYLKIVSAVLDNPGVKLADIRLSERKTVSPARKRLFNRYRGYLDSRDEQSFHISEAMIFEGKVDKEKLEKAFKELFRRYEILDKNFEMVDGEVVEKENGEFSPEVEIWEADDADIKNILDGNTPLRKVETVKPAQEHFSLSSVKLEKKQRRRKEI
jgi:malonyl CoA-acyl carrier protein transacylase/acyl carrier protein